MKFGDIAFCPQDFPIGTLGTRQYIRHLPCKLCPACNTWCPPYDDTKRNCLRIWKSLLQSIPAPVFGMIKLPPNCRDIKAISFKYYNPSRLLRRSVWLRSKFLNRNHFWRCSAEILTPRMLRLQTGLKGNHQELPVYCLRVSCLAVSCSSGGCHVENTARLRLPWITKRRCWCIERSDRFVL